MIRMAVVVIPETDYAPIRSRIPDLPTRFSEWNFETWKRKAEIEGHGHVAHEISITFADVLNNKITTVSGLESFAQGKLLRR